MTSNTSNSKTTNNTAQNKPTKSQVKLTGRMLNFTRLQLKGDDTADILTAIKDKLGKQITKKLPVVISLDGNCPIDTLWQGLWDIGLQPIGIIPNNSEQEAQAVKQQIAVFPADGQRIDGKQTGSTNQTANNTNESVAPTTSDNITSAQTTAHDSTENDPTQMLHQNNVEGDLVHHQILRSGQSINHVGGDVILTKGINRGAEAITDYSLHIYGKGEGRLVAGATGDKNARIFCLKFNPLLVSVAGTYCLQENIPTELLDKAVEVSFDDEQGLVFSLME